MTRARQYDFTWNNGNTIALIVLSVAAIVALAVSSMRGGTEFHAHMPIDPAKVSAAKELINPNTASVASLRRLPQVGPTIAARIVQYRQQHPAQPFRKPEDLEVVKRIGPATVAKISPYLSFRANAD